MDQLLHQLRLRRWRWLIEGCTTKTNSERELGQLGLPATAAPAAPGRIDPQSGRSRRHRICEREVDTIEIN